MTWKDWFARPRRRLVAQGNLRDLPTLLNPPSTGRERAVELGGDLIGLPRPTLFARISEHLADTHRKRLEAADEFAQLGVVRPRRRRGD